MDVKGARALSERLAAATHEVEPLAKAVDAGDTPRGTSAAAEVTASLAKHQPSAE